MNAGETQTELNGQFSPQRDGEADYYFTLPSDETIEQLRKRYSAAISELEAVEKDLKAHAKIAAHLPKGFSLQTVSFDYPGVSCKAVIERLWIRVKTDVPAAKPNKPSVWQSLGNRHDLIQILNSGALTKDEKRKVLGLPKLKAEGRQHDRSN